MPCIQPEMNSLVISASCVPLQQSGYSQATRQPRLPGQSVFVSDVCSRRWWRDVQHPPKVSRRQHRPLETHERGEVSTVRGGSWGEGLCIWTAVRRNHVPLRTRQRVFFVALSGRGADFSWMFHTLLSQTVSLTKHSRH